MIEYLNGKIAEVTPTTAIIDCNGVGYNVNISLYTYTSIQDKGSAKLYIYEAIREDAHLLFGFASKKERELFLLLISVSGIGGNTARMILSAYSPEELCNIISTGNHKLLSTVKGIGPKTAQRIIVDIKDKIANLDIASEIPSTTTINSEIQAEAVAALTMLGFPAQPSQKVVNAILKDTPDMAVEKVIKMALKML